MILKYKTIKLYIVNTIRYDYPTHHVVLFPVGFGFTENSVKLFWIFLNFVKKAVMIIERTKKEIIFRLPNNINMDDLQDLSDLFEYKEITRKSKATQKDVDLLVKTIKKGRWEKTKQVIKG